MREALAARDNERFRVRAAVSRRGKRRTFLLVDGVDAKSGESLFDHLGATGWHVRQNVRDRARSKNLRMTAENIKAA